MCRRDPSSPDQPGGARGVLGRAVRGAGGRSRGGAECTRFALFLVVFARPAQLAPLTCAYLPRRAGGIGGHGGGAECVCARRGPQRADGTADEETVLSLLPRSRQVHSARAAPLSFLCLRGPPTHSYTHTMSPRPGGRRGRPLAAVDANAAPEDRAQHADKGLPVPPSPLFASSSSAGAPALPGLLPRPPPATRTYQRSVAASVSFDARERAGHRSATKSTTPRMWGSAR